MRVSFDTNVLVYAYGLNDPVRYRTSVELMRSVSKTGCVLAAQALAEFHRVTTRKYRCPSNDIKDQIQLWTDVFEVAPTSGASLSQAMMIAERHNLQIFDAIIIAASAQAGCRVLFSEDMQHEAVFNGVTIINPFAEPKHPLLLDMLSAAKGKQT
jgi:predicted nucleic acid-binding protein